MKTFVFSVYDVKSKIFGSPFFSINRAVAIRDFATAVNLPDTQFYSNPEDFSLFAIGEFDNESATLVSYTPESICPALSVKRVAVDSPSLTSDLES